MKVNCLHCGRTHILRHRPKEIGRRLDHEEITIAAEREEAELAELETRRVAILRITYRRDFICSDCGYEWSEQLVTESQKHV